MTKRIALAALLLVVAAGSVAAKPKTIVARMWHGRVAAARADEYQQYLDTNGIQKIRKIKGNIGVQMLRRDLGDVTEFVVISYWPDRASIKAFAGEDIEKVHDLPRDAEFLINPERTVAHYDVIIDRK